MDAKEHAYQLLEHLLNLIHDAEQGVISFEDIFSAIPLRDFLPPCRVLATTWHIEDIRDRFPEGTSDQVLIEQLRGIEGALKDAAVIAGWEVIDEYFPKLT